MTTSETETRYAIETADSSDIPRLAELLVELYRGECPELIPRRSSILTQVIEDALGSDIDALRSTFVLRDRDAGDRIVASVVASTSTRPRTSPINVRHILRTLRTARTDAARILYTQHRLAVLLCASLPPRTTQLHSLIIDQNYRGHRLGTALVRSVEHHALDASDDTVHLYILDGNDVENFYSRLGYTRIAISPKKLAYPGIAMTKKIHKSTYPPIAGTTRKDANQ